MSKMNHAIDEIRRMAELAERDGWLHRLHPLAKLLVTFFYIAVVVSFSPYHLTGLLGMSIYPVVLFIAGEISVKDSLRRLRIVLPLVCCVGLFNPFFDRQIFVWIGGFGISTGMVSMCTLMIKGLLTVLAAYLLMVSTTIEEICYALRQFHVPRMIVTVIMLIYRYITLLMEEAQQMMQAYALRAPLQKGIHIRAWGSFAGMLLLRSMDRAQQVYESMCLRGFDGNFYIHRDDGFKAVDAVYLGGWFLILSIFRIFPVFQLVGSLMM